MFGDGVRHDKAQALHWFKKAAEQGDSDSQVNVGGLYYQGEGVEKKIDEAIRWWRKAADQGDATAMCNLGVMYLRGQDVPEDHVKALGWFAVAAGLGNEDAIEYCDQLKGELEVDELEAALELVSELLEKLKA